MRYLIDTDVLSLSRRRPANTTFATFVSLLPPGSAAVSALTIGEIRRGIERARHQRDRSKVNALERWLPTVLAAFPVLPIDTAVATRWGRLGVPDPLPFVDGLIAATALEHGLTVVTRNVRDFTRCGVDVIDPYGED